MEPVSLELNKIRTGHNSETDLASALMAHWTKIKVVSDVAFVGMRAPKLPKSFVGWIDSVAKTSGNLDH
jgi:hypothetical protein